MADEIPSTDVPGVGSDTEGGVSSTDFASRGILTFLNDGDENGSEKESESKESKSVSTEGAEDPEGTNDGKLLEEKEEEPGDKTAPRLLTLKSGDKTFEVPDDALLEVPVDGKKEKVSISDLKKDYAGRVAWDKKFTELSKDRKEFKDDVALIDRKLIKVFGAFEKGDLATGLKILYDMKGEKVEGDLEEHFISKTRAMIEEIEKLSPDERKIRKDRLALDAEREELDNAKKEKDLEESKKKITDYIDSEIKTHKIEPEVFNQTWQNLSKMREEMVRKGEPDPFKGYKQEDLANLVVGRVLVDRNINTLQTVSRNVNPKATDGDIRAMLDIVTDFEKSEGRLLGDDEIEFVVREYFGNPKKPNVATKPKSEGRPPSRTPERSKPGAPSEGKSEVAEEEEDYSNFSGLLRSIGVS